MTIDCYDLIDKLVGNRERNYVYDLFVGDDRGKFLLGMAFRNLNFVEDEENCWEQIEE